MSAASRETRRTGPLVAIALTVVSLAIGLAMIEFAARVLMPHWSDFSSARFMTRGDVAGYASFSLGRAGFDGRFAQNDGDFHVRVRINADGLRNPDPLSAAGGRVWAIGDSFTFGWGVERAERFSDVAAQAAGRPVFNLASPGTDICGYQALVAMAPRNVKPVAIVVGLVLENDLAVYRCARGAAPPGQPAPAGEGAVRLVDVKKFFTTHSALYNFLAVSLKRVKAVNELLQAAGLVAPGHAWEAAFNTASLARAVASTTGEIDWMRGRFPPGAPFAVLIIPGRFELIDGNALYALARRAMAAALTARGMTVIDPFDALKTAGYGKVHFAHDGHWTPLGHRIAGEAIAGWLRGLPAGTGPVK